ncbi:MAG TPA: class I SAM-dependent methyltransferase [Gemmatimonadota bacterium]|nr:class I SAM-dependent methyltransferase [Gemmatimonadota bacterium]
MKALHAIVRYWLLDDLYAEDEYGSRVLHNLERARLFNQWMADAIAPYVGARVFEVGAGIGNITRLLLPRDLYLASDINPHHLAYLRNFALGKSYLQVESLDLEDPVDFERWRGRFDTVICLNVLEHVSDPVRSLHNIHSCLARDGKLLLYVPQGPGLCSSLDEVLGHRCRYDQPNLFAELAEAGFEVESCREFNRAGVPGWVINGKIRRRRSFSPFQLKIFNSLVPLLRRIDGALPWRGLGLLAVARRS